MRRRICEDAHVAHTNVRKAPDGDRRGGPGRHLGKHGSIIERERCNDFSIGIELEGTDEEPYDGRQYESLADLVEATLPDDFDASAFQLLTIEAGGGTTSVKLGETTSTADAEGAVLETRPVLLGETARPMFDGLHIDAMTERLKMRIVETRRIGEDVRVLLRPEVATGTA